MTRRLILHTDFTMQHDWPDDVVVQGGTNGVVFNDDGPNYTTAFVEAFPNTFLRGEGKTLAEAEDKVWEQFQHLLACPTYPAHGPFERRQYRNGAGYCVNCGGWFSGQVTGFEELPDDPDQPRRKSLMEQIFEEALKGNTETVVEIFAEDTKATDEDKAQLVKAIEKADYEEFKKLMIRGVQEADDELDLALNMKPYIIEWVPKPQHTNQKHLNVHHSEIQSNSATSAALRAQADHYGPYRVNRVFELALDLSNEGNSGDQADDGHGGREEQAPPRDGA